MREGRVVHERPGDRASTSTGSSTWSWKEARRERQETPRRRLPATPDERAGPGAAGRHRPASAAASRRVLLRLARSGATSAWSSRWCMLCIVGITTAGDRFASVDNLLTILRLASVIGVVIDRHDVRDHRRRHRPVGRRDRRAGLGLGDHAGHPALAAARTGSSWCSSRCSSGCGCGLVNGAADRLRRMVPFIATLAMLVAARGLAEIIAEQQDPDRQRAAASSTSSGDDVLGIPLLVIIFALVAVVGWVRAQPHHLRPAHLRRRRQPRGRPAGRHQRPAAHGAALRAVGLCCGIAAVMIVARTTTGSLDPRQALRARRHRRRDHRRHPAHGGRGTIVGTVLGVLIFTTLTNVFTLNNLSTSAPDRRQGRDHRRRRAAPAAARGAQQQRQTLDPAPPSHRHVHHASPHQPRLGPPRRSSHVSHHSLAAGSRWRPEPPLRRRRCSCPPARTDTGRHRQRRAAATSDAAKAASAQRRPGREGHHRLLRPRRPTTAGSPPSTATAKAEAEKYRRRRASSGRGHQRRQPADQPGRDVHQRQGRRDRAAAVRRRRADRRRASRRWRPASRSSTSTASSPPRSPRAPRSSATTTAWASRPAPTSASCSRTRASTTRSIAEIAGIDALPLTQDRSQGLRGRAEGAAA